jgi:hypothetical protein
LHDKPRRLMATCPLGTRVAALSLLY